jgi:hypothetical protein
MYLYHVHWQYRPL